MSSERRLELLTVIYGAVRDAGEPSDWQMEHPVMSYINVQFDKRDWINIYVGRSRNWKRLNDAVYW